MNALMHDQSIPVLAVHLKDCMFINATCKQDKWWEQFLELIRGACPSLPPKKKFHAFFAHAPADKPWVADVVKMLESRTYSLSKMAEYYRVQLKLE
jgi:hypothetical protein